MDIIELPFSVRVMGCLDNRGIYTVRELISYSEQDLLKTRNLGKTSLNEIKSVLASLGLTLDIHGKSISYHEAMIKQYDKLANEHREKLKAQTRALSILNNPTISYDDAVAVIATP